VFENIAAIDIGTSSIKVVAVKTGLNNYQIKSFFIQNIEFDENDELYKIEEALEQIKNEIDLSIYTVVSNIPMEKFILRDLKFPFNDPVKIAEILPFEAEEIIPYNINDAIIDFQTIKSENKNEGNIIFAATHKFNVSDYLEHFKKQDIHLSLCGLESNALYECYRYYNKIQEETIFQIHIGNSKTIVNIISNHNLLFSRVISLGTEKIIRFFSDILDVDPKQSLEIFKNLNIDLTSFENNIQRAHYKDLKISKKDFKDIFNYCNSFFQELLKQIGLTKKSFDIKFPNKTFNRIMISGGGSNIKGVGNFIAEIMDLPVVSLPFPDDYNDENIKSTFPIALGTILSYLNHKQYHINVLKDEFINKNFANKNKNYYLFAFFTILTTIAFIFYIIIFSIIRSSENKIVTQQLENAFTSKFRVRNIKTTPFKEARKMLSKEKKELKEIEDLLGNDSSITLTLNELISSFVKDKKFDIKRLTINKKNIKIKGNCNSVNIVDKYKENLDLKKRKVSK